MEVSGQFHEPAALSPRKGPSVLIGSEAGWSPDPVWSRWRREKYSAPAGKGAPIVQPVP
jgi:hypothetical protein